MGLDNFCNFWKTALEHVLEVEIFEFLLRNLDLYCLCGFVDCFFLNFYSFWCLFVYHLRWILQNCRIALVRRRRSFIRDLGLYQIRMVFFRLFVLSFAYPFGQSTVEICSFLVKAFCWGATKTGILWCHFLFLFWQNTLFLLLIEWRIHLLPSSIFSPSPIQDRED